MKQHEYGHAPKEARIPDFIEPFDGTQQPIDPSEQASVTECFEEFVDTVGMNHLADSYHDGYMATYLELYFNAGNGWSFHVTKLRYEMNELAHLLLSDLPHIPRGRRELYAERIVDDNIREAYTYYVNPQGVTCRHNHGDSYAKYLKSRASQPQAAPETKRGVDFLQRKTLKKQLRQ